jgi:hypothetical protein
MNVLLSAITPSAAQLSNSYVTQLVNTGDRIKDNAIVLIANALISFVCAWAYDFLSTVPWRKWWFASDDSGSADKGLDTLAIMRKHDITDASLGKYAYAHALDHFTTVDYILSNTKSVVVGSTGCVVMISKEGRITSGSTRLSTVAVAEYQLPDQTAPGYVFMHNNTIRSENLAEVRKYLKGVFDGMDDVEKAKLGPKTHGIYNVHPPKSAASNASSALTTAKIATLSPKATFDTVHFTTKHQLLSLIAKFQAKTMYPPELGAANKLGILLYGPPGTGKSKTVAAVANLLGRDVVNINLAELYHVTQESFLEMAQEKAKTSVFVFDELDHLLQNASRAQDKPVVDSDDSDGGEGTGKDADFATASTKVRGKIAAKWQNVRQSRNVIDEAFLLRFLDGIGDDDERVIMGCTNHPQKIDPTYVRAGRFDIKLKLSFCTSAMFDNIVSIKFGRHAMKAADVEAAVAKNVTPASLIQMMVEAETLPDFVAFLDATPHGPTYDRELRVR